MPSLVFSVEAHPLTDEKIISKNPMKVNGNISQIAMKIIGQKNSADNREKRNQTQSPKQIQNHSNRLLIQCKHYTPSWVTIATEKNGNISQNPPGDGIGGR